MNYPLISEYIEAIKALGAPNQKHFLVKLKYRKK